jgi:hypothetical protein
MGSDDTRVLLIDFWTVDVCDYDDGEDVHDWGT